MTFNTFKDAPWKQENTHPKYKQSSLSITPAPEYASSEVLVASLYRTIGFSSTSEGSVSQAGRELDRKIQRLRAKNSSRPIAATIDADTWGAILHGVLESPKLPNQSSRRFLQVTPLVPGSALFSGAARLAGNPWNPGSLVRRMVLIGSGSSEAAAELWGDLFSSLGVGEADDVFARWLDQEISAWGSPQAWGLVPIPDTEAGLSSEDFRHLAFLPARQFAKDLRAIIQVKDAMTRRQWTSLLEAVLRLASVSHMAWLCDVQARTWDCLSKALLKKEVPVGEGDARQAIFPEAASYLTYGSAALPRLKDKASRYLTARLGINMVLWSLEHCGAPFEGNISSSHGISQLCQHIRDHHEALDRLGTWHAFADIREREARALSCTKGIGKNLLEFARHAMGQRQTAAPLLKGYDQGYVLKKKGSSSSSPWVVSLGPVAVLCLVHCTLAGMGGPRSIHRLGQHLAAYGIAVDRRDIATNDLGHQLRMLGLVLDSPDAESGMLLLPPFPTTQAMGKEA